MRKIRLTIFGSYNKNSVGDKAILISLLDLLFRNSTFKLKINVLAFQAKSISDEIQNYKWKENVNIVPLGSPTTSKNSQKYRYKKRIFDKIPRFLQTIFGLYLFNKSLKNINYQATDALIIGGGNLLMDMYATWPGRPFILQRKFLNNDKPTYLLGVGAFPIKNKLSNHLLRCVTQNSQLVFVRDKETREFIQHKWNIPAEYHPDLAFSFPLNKDSYPKKNLSLKIAINVAPLYGKSWPYQDYANHKYYIDLVSKQLFNYYSNNKKVRYVFYDTNYPTDREASLIIINKIVKLGYPQEFISYDDRLHTSAEIVNILKTTDFAITTRLHASILAIRTGIPIIAIAYQPKVLSVLSAAGIDNHAIIDVSRLEKISSSLNILNQKKEIFKLDSKQLDKLDNINFQIVDKILSDISKTITD